MSSRVKPSSNRRMKGPIAQEALLSFAFDSSSAERPSKSRRLTSLPRVAPTISPRGSTISTTSGSGLFQVESDRTPIGAPVPTVESTGDLEKTSASGRSEEHTSELQSLMRISYAVFCLKKKKKTHQT